MNINDFNHYEIKLNDYFKQKNYDITLKNNQVVMIYQLDNPHHQQHIEFLKKNDQMNDLYFGKYGFQIENDMILQTYRIDEFIKMIQENQIGIIRRLNDQMVLESEEFYMDQDEFQSVINEIHQIKKKLFKKQHYYEIYNYQNYELILK